MPAVSALRVGIYDHLGWAIAVTATRGHDLVDRRRIELVEPGVPSMPIHHPGPDRSLEAIAERVARVRASAERATTAALDALERALPSPIASMHLRALPLDFPSALAAQLRPPYEARADAIMYRQVLAHLAQARGWVVLFYQAKSVEAQAGAILGDRTDAVLHARRGPPWTREHRAALAAAVCS